MKKPKKIIIIISLILLLGLVPIKQKLKDGGTVVYRAAFYSYSKVHELVDDRGYKVGTRVRILGFTVYDDVALE